ncbi:MAG: hypothetical protein LBH09_02115 [Peptococcaceae bacterium]|jgi:predicted Fe-Mo cluster-binding NifX family protein|nr:hypothetical protein [Peptococcaceae bacterium]
MLKVAVATSDATASGVVPALFQDATHLLIIDAETGEVLEVVEGENPDQLERSLYLAGKVVEFDCEALLCGGLEREPFAVLAEENCVTRFDAAGLYVQDGICRMNENTLGLITDFIGGTGCPDADPSNCGLHDED